MVGARQQLTSVDYVQPESPMGLNLTNSTMSDEKKISALRSKFQTVHILSDI